MSGSQIPTPYSPYATRLPLFPITTSVQESVSADRELTLAGQSVVSLAQRFGTPLYLFDQATLDAAVQAYRTGLAHAYPGPTGITYAAKALLNLAVATWAHRRDLLIDCTGAGEIHVAQAAGVPPSHILVHGVNKSDEDLEAALRHAGVIVVDNLFELTRLQARYAALSPNTGPALWLRLRPGVAVETHAYRQTGQEESKFGLSLTEADEAVAFCLRHKLPLTGVHFHQGSHFHDPAPLGPALDTILDQIGTLQQRHGWTPQLLSPGGGWGVAYTEAELPQPGLDAYLRFIGERLAQGCATRGLPLPCLQVEPGRSLVARAGVAVYRVGATKQAGDRRYVLLDGGMADNPRPALYGAGYSALPALNPARTPVAETWLAGPYCESGDVIIQALPLPDLAPGELLAVPVSGAYHLAMGSNYNGARKPAVVWLAQDQAFLIQRRETVDDLIRRDSMPDAFLAFEKRHDKSPQERHLHDKD
jgi:diaminopimelate decarboxylase